MPPWGGALAAVAKLPGVGITAAMAQLRLACRAEGEGPCRPQGAAAAAGVRVLGDMQVSLLSAGGRVGRDRVCSRFPLDGGWAGIPAEIRMLRGQEGMQCDAVTSQGPGGKVFPQPGAGVRGEESKLSICPSEPPLSRSVFLPRGKRGAALTRGSGLRDVALVCTRSCRGDGGGAGRDPLAVSSCRRWLTEQTMGKDPVTSSCVLLYRGSLGSRCFTFKVAGPDGLQGSCLLSHAT